MKLAILLVIALSASSVLGAPVGQARVRRQACGNFFECLMNVIKPPINAISNFPQQIQNQANTAIGVAVSNMLNQLQGAIFQQQALDFKQMTNKFLDDIKSSIINGLKDQAAATSQQMTDAAFQSAQQFVNDQINALKALAAKAPLGEFSTALTNGLTAIQNNLQGVFPAISSLINAQMSQFISNLNLIVPNISIPNLG